MKETNQIHWSSWEKDSFTKMYRRSGVYSIAVTTGSKIKPSKRASKIKEKEAIFSLVDCMERNARIIRLENRL